MSYPHHSTEQYKGIDIQINYDQTAENPFEQWDGCIPLIALYDRSRKDYSDGQIVDYLRNYLNYNQVKRNQTKLLNLMHYDVQEFRDDYPLQDYDRTEQLKDDVLYDWLGDCMENMEQFCKAFNIKHYCGYSTGYSQSDWAKIFMCWTPEFEKITGRTYKSMDDKDFEDGLKLYSDWAWGDVYWFDIEDEDGNHIGSCGGFYGDNFETNGLMEHAQSDIDCYLENKRKNKQSKLKTLIKNHVPLQNRNRILEAV